MEPQTGAVWTEPQVQPDRPGHAGGDVPPAALPHTVLTAHIVAFDTGQRFGTIPALLHYSMLRRTLQRVVHGLACWHPSAIAEAAAQELDPLRSILKHLIEWARR